MEDNLDDWIQRLQTGPPHKCAAIFIDNSGIDIILGILPFARDLLQRGTKVSFNDECSLCLTLFFGKLDIRNSSNNVNYFMLKFFVF